MLGRRADALGRKGLDRRLLHVGKLDIGAVEGFEIAAVDGRPARCERVPLRRQLFAQDGVRHLLGDLAPDELCGRVIGGFRQQDVVICERETEAEAVPGGLVDLFALLRRGVERRNAILPEAEAGRRIARLLASRGVVRLDSRSSSSVTGALAAGML